MTAFTEAYRPKTIDDMVGNEKAKSQVRAWTKTGRYPSVICFSGGPSAGKTTLSRIIARVRCCYSPKTGNPCFACAGCDLFDKNRDHHPGYMEQDAGSSRGIGDMRDLMAQARTLPRPPAKLKTIVIDEAHGITKDGQDSLLKFLEEPPPHVLVILCTTELSKIREAIVTRCSHISLTELSTDECSSILQRVVTDQKIDTITAQHLDKISRAVRCVPRKALHVLDQVYTQILSLEGTDIDVDGHVDAFVREVSASDIDTAAAFIVKDILSARPAAALARAGKVKHLGSELAIKMSTSLRHALVRALSEKLADLAYEDLWFNTNTKTNERTLVPIFTYTRECRQVILDAFTALNSIQQKPYTFEVVEEGIVRAGLIVQSFIDNKKRQDLFSNNTGLESILKTDHPVVHECREVLAQTNTLSVDQIDSLLKLNVPKPTDMSAWSAPVVKQPEPVAVVDKVEPALTTKEPAAKQDFSVLMGDKKPASSLHIKT
jgi:DNA polymerase III subunit gamma/tau